jgi:hypothetical protein
VAATIPDFFVIISQTILRDFAGPPVVLVFGIGEWDERCQVLPKALHRIALMRPRWTVDGVPPLGLLGVRRACIKILAA